jgi:hypothetical protein
MEPAYVLGYELNGSVDAPVLDAIAYLVRHAVTFFGSGSTTMAAQKQHTSTDTS